jgi:hypothetical protein
VLTLQGDAVTAESTSADIPRVMSEAPLEGVPMDGLRRSGHHREPPKNLGDYVL